MEKAPRMHQSRTFEIKLDFFPARGTVPRGTLAIYPFGASIHVPMRHAARPWPLPFSNPGSATGKEGIALL